MLENKEKLDKLEKIFQALREEIYLGLQEVKQRPGLDRYFWVELYTNTMKSLTELGKMKRKCLRELERKGR